MKYYLSSYRIGNHGNELQELTRGGKLAYIGNALDNIPREKTLKTFARNINDLKELNIDCQELDLREFFDKPKELNNRLSEYSGVWITGGNVFVLRQAMKLSGFDKVILNFSNYDFLYAGYSAGVCVLAPQLEGFQIVDDANSFPYKQITETLWEGLNILDYAILPHYKSDHPESEEIEKEVQYCKDNNIPYKTLRDGEVLFGDSIDRVSKIEFFDMQERQP